MEHADFFWPGEMGVADTLAVITRMFIGPAQRSGGVVSHTEVENAMDQQARIIRILHKQRDFIGQQDERKPPESE